MPDALDLAAPAPAAEPDAAGGRGQAGVRKRMTIFRGHEGAELDHETMPFEGIDETVLAGFAKLIAAGSGPGTGEQTRLLFREPGEGGLSLAYAWFKSGYILPRHSHDADCVYYVLAGDLRMGTATLAKGDGVFVPAGDTYTYQVGEQGVAILEFRNASRFNILFTGNDEAHWDRMADVQRAKREVWPTEVAPDA